MSASFAAISAGNSNMDEQGGAPSVLPGASNETSDDTTIFPLELDNSFRPQYY